MNMPGSATVNTIRDRWDQFFTWLFKGWGYNASTRPDSPHQIRDRVSAKVDAQDAEAYAAEAYAAEAEREQVSIKLDLERELANRRAQDAQAYSAAAERERDRSKADEPTDVDTRPQPVPQNLDNLTGGVAAPPPAEHDSVSWQGEKLWTEFDHDWCTCEGIHEAHCGFAAPALSINNLLPAPPSSGTAPTEPAPSQL